MDARTPAPEIFATAEAFGAYIDNVRQRRQANRERRARLAFLRGALDAVAAEMAEAEEEGDAGMVEELAIVRAEFARILAQTETDPPAPIAGADPLPAAEPSLQDAGSEPAGFPQAPPQHDTPEPPSTELGGEPPAAAAPPERLPPDARAVPYLDELSDLSRARAMMDRSGSNGGGSRGWMFRMRALACAAGSVLARARDEGLEAAVAESAHAMRDAVQMALQYGGDGAECLPLEEQAWSGPAALSAETWQTLRVRYERTAEAADAFDWHAPLVKAAAEERSIPLISHVAAAEKALQLRLEAAGGGDALRDALHSDLMNLAYGLGQIGPLHQSVTAAKLEALADQLSACVATVRQQAADRREQAARVHRKDEAVERVLSWRKEVSANTPAPDQVERLGELLDECQAAGVPPTHRQIRDALLDVEGDPLAAFQRHTKVQEAVHAERRRRGLCSSPDPEDDAERETSAGSIEQYEAVVAGFMRGLNVTILGGVSRSRTCDELRERLGCADVRWPKSQKSDKVGKFEADVRRADVLLLCKNFAGHDMSDRGRDWMKEKGGHFVLLTGGYGVNQIIYRLHEHITGRNGHA